LNAIKVVVVLGVVNMLSILITAAVANIYSTIIMVKMVKKGHGP